MRLLSIASMMLASALFIGVASEALAGAVGGPIHRTGSLAPDESQNFSLVVDDTNTTVIVHGDGSSDLDCFVFDGGGNLIAAAADQTDTCYMVLQARARDTRLILRISNNGKHTDEFSISTD